MVGDRMSAKVRQDPGSARHQGLASAAADLAVEGTMPSLDGATTWLNSPPLTPDGLRGRVVLVQFWTYTCINWLRTLPYVRAWTHKYRDRGLVVIGVHTPEFGFEQDLDNVRRAVQAMGIDYPVAIDSDYRVWGAFANHYWPALYFVDAQGQIRHHRFGEGDYERSEMVLQQLLAAAGTEAVPDGLVSVDGAGAEAAADWADLRSPETYIGYDGGAGFEPFDGLVADARQRYTAPVVLGLNRWSLSGDWTVSAGMVALNEPGGRIACRFHARDLHLVMGPAARGTSVRYRVLIDGRPAGAAHGADADGEGGGTVVDQRMYQLIRQPAPIRDRRFEIEFLDAGVEAFVFTFG
jgi:thiol-disulfide isomerase/thioredoxin